MTLIVTTQHPSLDHRWSSTADAVARPNALIVDGLKLPATVSLLAAFFLAVLQPRGNPLTAAVSNTIVRSSHPDRSHFPHRKRPHLA